MHVIFPVHAGGQSHKQFGNENKLVFNSQTVNPL